MNQIDKSLSFCDYEGLNLSQNFDMSMSIRKAKEATLYTAFRRLEQGGYIVSYWGDETQGGRRKYYRITDEGKRLYAQNEKDWDFAQDVLNKLIKGGLNDVK